MMYGVLFDIVLLMLFAAMGALVAVWAMQWHNKDKDRAVRAEMAKTERWRTEAEGARIKVAERSGWLTSVELEASPAPLSFGYSEERELHDNGGFIRQRRNG